MTDLTSWEDGIRDAAHDAVFKANETLARKLNEAFAGFPEAEARAVKLKKQPKNKVRSRVFLRPVEGAEPEEAILFNLRITDEPRDVIYPAGSPNYVGKGKNVNEDARVLKFNDGEFRTFARWPEQYDVAVVERLVGQWVNEVAKALRDAAT